MMKPLACLLLPTLLPLCLACGDEDKGPAGPAEQPVETVPESWAGLWKGTETLRDCTTNDGGTEPDQTWWFCQGQSVAEVLVGRNQGVQCTGGFTSTTFTFDCAWVELDNGCFREFQATGELRKSSTRITGSGELHSKDVDPAAACTGADECLRINVSLTRQGVDCQALENATALPFSHPSPQGVQR